MAPAALALTAALLGASTVLAVPVPVSTHIIPVPGKHSPTSPSTNLDITTAAVVPSVPPTSNPTLTPPTIVDIALEPDLHDSDNAELRKPVTTPVSPTLLHSPWRWVCPWSTHECVIGDKTVCCPDSVQLQPRGPMGGDENPVSSALDNTSSSSSPATISLKGRDVDAGADTDIDSSTSMYPGKCPPGTFFCAPNPMMCCPLGGLVGSPPTHPRPTAAEPGSGEREDGSGE